MKNVEDAVRDVFATVSGIRDTAGDKPFEDYEIWDSLRHAEFILKLQEAFSIRFDVPEILSFKCLNHVITCVDERTQQGSKP